MQRIQSSISSWRLISPIHALSKVSSEIEGMIGDVVVQVYVQDPNGVIGRIVRPLKRLVAFARIFHRDRRSIIDIPIAADDLAMYRDDMTLIVHSGLYTFSIGLSSISEESS